MARDSVCADIGCAQIASGPRRTLSKISLNGINRGRSAEFYTQYSAHKTRDIFYPSFCLNQMAEQTKRRDSQNTLSPPQNTLRIERQARSWTRGSPLAWSGAAGRRQPEVNKQHRGVRK